MKTRLLITLFLICSALSAEETLPSTEIRVHLPTSNALESLYISKVQTTQPAFDTVYLKQLETVLTYDLNHNGSTTVVPQSPEKEQLIHKNKTAAFQAATWKDLGITYAVRLFLQEKHLTVCVFDAQTESLKTFPELALTGDLNQDRRQMHKIADGIHKTLFHEEGIAQSQILFAYQVKNPKNDGSDWVSEIWECDWDGANLHQLTHEASYCVTPIAIPKGSRSKSDSFLYVSYQLGQPKIYIGSVKGGKGKRLIDLRGNQLLPAISPTKDKLAFICDAGGRTDLFLQPFHPATGQTGKPQQLFSYPRSTQASPTFSPDGSKIAFVSDKDGGMRIYLLSAAHTEKRQNPVMLSKKNRENSCPCWSPDGTKLAYSAKTNGVRQIWIYDFATEEETQLTSGPGNKENPCFASNSKHIVFNSTDNATSELYIVNLNQSEAIKISRGPGKKHYPSWNPSR